MAHCRQSTGRDGRARARHDGPRRLSGEHLGKKSSQSSAGRSWREASRSHARTAPPRPSRSWDRTSTQRCLACDVGEPLGVLELPQGRSRPRCRAGAARELEHRVAAQHVEVVRVLLQQIAKALALIIATIVSAIRQRSRPSQLQRTWRSATPSTAPPSAAISLRRPIQACRHKRGSDLPSTPRNERAGSYRRSSVA